MEAYLQKLSERSYELIEISPGNKDTELHIFVIFMILVKSTLNRMTSLEGTQSR